MKITCDLCGSALQMNMNGQGATCTSCGMIYSMEHLREKLKALQSGGKSNTITTEKGGVKAFADSDFDFVPKQFMMDLCGGGNGDLSGRIQQGGVGLGDQVYLDGDYKRPYRVYSINDSVDVVCAKAGEHADLFVSPFVRKIFKKAKLVTGDPNPVANAYNYPGTVSEYFAKVIAAEFSEYEIETDVYFDDVKIPVSFLLCKNDEPVLAVFLVNSNDSKVRYQVEKAGGMFADAGFGCTHFFDNYRNDLPYVVHRIRKALGQ